MKVRNDGTVGAVREPPLRANVVLFVIPAKAGIHLCLCFYFLIGPRQRREDEKPVYRHSASEWIPSNPPSPVGSDTGMTAVLKSRHCRVSQQARERPISPAEYSHRPIL